ncbi:serine hydrolase [Azospirillum halopraeferens]|uniref:serine hydrolase n=1 Tax=Azospirillum halopraeferens TaxID=34010 RepID=UPI00041DFF1F|nr:serine hydrolase [Azospirillum halopraeferens]
MAAGATLARRIGAAALTLLVALAAPAAVADDGLQRLLDRYLEREGVDGGVLLVSGPGGRTVVASGIADRRRGARVTPDTRFYIASAGKMATAVAVLRQVEDGRLALDQPVRDLAGPLRLDRLANAARARLVDLLDHSSGIPDYITDAYVEEERARPGVARDAATLLAFATGEPATGAVGKHYSYSNSNYVLLGHIAAVADGQSFPQVLRRRVLESAGMTATTVGADPGDPTLAHGYTDDGDVSLPSWMATTGDGPLVTTAGDLERFLFALFRDGRLLGPATLERMRTPSRSEPDAGLGLELWSDRWGRGMGHTGSYDGFEADVRYYADRGTAMVLLMNGNTSSDDALLDEVAERLFADRPAGREAKGPAASGTPLCRPGRAVEVLWEGDWYPARVRGEPDRNGACPVRYDGYGSEDDESVPPKRLRAPRG